MSSFLVKLNHHDFFNDALIYLGDCVIYLLRYFADAITYFNDMSLSLLTVSTTTLVMLLYILMPISVILSFTRTIPYIIIYSVDAVIKWRIPPLQ